MNNDSNDFEWTEKLIKQNLDNKNFYKLSIKDKYGSTGFMRACINQPELSEMMLERKDINFNLQDNNGWTGFTIACQYQPELVKIMLKKDNIDFNIQNKWGNTGFIIACERHPELLNTMLNNKKIDKNLKNQDGLTGYDLAKEENLKSFEIYQSWLEQKNINNQVQKRTKKPSQHL